MPDPKSAAMPDDLRAELARSEPDYMVHVSTGDHDAGNEHFLVTDAPDGTLMAAMGRPQRSAGALACTRRASFLIAHCPLPPFAQE